MLKEVYCIIVSGTFDREPIFYDEEPTKDQIYEALKLKGGETARVEKRYSLTES